MSQYFVISNMLGEGYINSLTHEELLQAMAGSHPEHPPIDSEVVMEGIPTDRIKFWSCGTKVIIKGEIVVPRRVTSWTIE